MPIPKPPIDYVDHYILKAILEHEIKKKKLSILQLAEVIDMAYKNVLPRLKKLEGIGLVRRDEKAIKGRTTLLGLTNIGRNYLLDIKIEEREKKEKELWKRFKLFR